MKDPIPQDPAAWAARILALKHAEPFQAFSVVMASGRTILPVTRPEQIEVPDRRTCAELAMPDGTRHWLALEWVTDIEIGGEVGAAPRPPRYAAKLRDLPDGPLVLSMGDGRRFPLAGPRQILVAPDGRSVAVCNKDGGLAILKTSDISDLEPGS